MRGDLGSRLDLVPPPSFVVRMPELREKRASQAYAAMQRIYPSLDALSIVVTKEIPGESPIDNEILRNLLLAGQKVMRGEYADARVNFAFAHNAFASIYGLADEDEEFRIGLVTHLSGRFSRNELAILATATEQEFIYLREILSNSKRNRR